MAKDHVPPQRRTAQMTWRRDRLWLVAAVYSVLAVAATMAATHRVWYVADNRFEQYLNPARSLTSMFSIWDGSRGLGGPREDVWIASTLPIAVMRWIGLSAPVAERLFHAGLLVTAGLGVVVLVRVFRPQVGAVHVIAGLLVMFGPFSASFLLPSNLYVMFAISPWLVVILVRGMTSDEPWRWAAAFALVVFVAGNADVPGLLYATLVLAVTTGYLILVERATTWRSAVGWVARAAVLTIACSSWALTKTYFAAEPLDARLADTELPTASATSSSWSESFRGLGNWLSYFTERGQPVKPHTTAYFEEPLLILVTFIPAIVALVVLWRSPTRHRILFGALAIVGITAMVGGFGVPNSSPLGDGVLWIFNNVNPVKSMRNTYKAGAGLVIGVSVLAAIGAVAVHARAARRSRRTGIASATIGVLILSLLATPFVRAATYAPDEQVAEVPTYWDEALEFIDARPDGRSLIVPAVSQAEYRWGYVGDDLFDALLDRSHATATGWMLSSRTGHNALEQLTLSAQEPFHRPGVLAAITQRLGIDEIVVRNDLNWQNLDIARPILFEALRSDPDFELVATFGRPGQFVASRLDTSPDAAFERTLPPVEIYRRRGVPAEPLVSVSHTAPTSGATSDTVITTGDTGAWSQATRAGLVESSTPLAASAALDDAEVIALIDDGARVVMTDTARRRVRWLLHHEPELSPTLAHGQELDRPVRPVYPDRPGAESVAWYPDADRISGAYVALGGLRNDRRPALAFDGDDDTAWAVPWSGLGDAPTIKVDLRRPESIGRVTLQSTVNGSGIPTVTRASITLGDGDETIVRLDRSGRGDIDLGGVLTDDITVAVDSIGVFGTEVGFREIDIAGLDLTEFIQLPTDLIDRGEAVGEALERAPTAYAFRRVSRPVSSVRSDPRSTSFDEEQTLRRRFTVASPAEFEVRGALRLLATTSDETIARLFDLPVTARAARGPGTRFDGPAALMVDGDLGTSWIGEARRGSEITIDIPEQDVRTVRVRQPIDAFSAPIETITVHVGDEVVRARFGPRRCATWPVAACSSFADVALPAGTRSDQVTVRLGSVDTERALVPDQVRIAEVSIDGANTIDPGDPVADSCLDLGLTVTAERSAGDSVSVPVRTDATVEEILDGEVVPFESCGPLPLEAGTHQLVTSPGSMFDEVALVPASGWEVSSDGIDVEASIVRRSPDRLTVDIPATTPGTDVTVTLRSSFDPNWRLIADDRSVPSSERDAGNQWIIDGGAARTVTLEYAPSRILRVAVAASLVSVLACAAIIASRRRTTEVVDLADDPDAATPDEHHGLQRRDLVVVTVATVAGVLLAGPLALIIGAATVVALSRLPGWRTQVGVAAPVLLGLAAVWSAAVDPGRPVNIAFAANRWEPSALAALAVAFSFQTVALGGVDSRRPAPPVRAIRRRPTVLGEALGLVDDRRIVGAVVAGALATGFAVALRLDVGELTEAAVSRVRLGLAFDDDSPPLPTVVAALSPFPQRWVAGGLAVVTVVASCVLAGRWVQYERRRAATLTTLALCAIATVVLVDALSVLAALAFVTLAGVVCAGRFHAGAVVAAVGLVVGVVLSWRGLPPSTWPLCTIGVVGAAIGAAVARARPVHP